MLKGITEQSLRARRLVPAIICTADCYHYLVGAKDESGMFYNVFSEDEKRPLFRTSLDQAKKTLKEQGIKKVLVEIQTPYDEMVGLQASNTVVTLETL